MLWPTIRNDGDFDYVTTQGCRICFIVAVLTIAFSAIAGSPVTGAFEGVFYFLAGAGVRQRSRIAGIAAFTAYLLGSLVLQRYTGNGFSVLRIVFLALLFANIRGNWLSARWAREQQPSPPPVRLDETFGDKLADQLPAWLWPKVQFVFYAVAGIEIALLLLSLFAPRP